MLREPVIHPGDELLSRPTDLGDLCRVHQDHVLRNLSCQRIQCDEIGSFCGAKEKQAQAGAKGDGDVWTWTAMCADSKLMVPWVVGTRRKGMAIRFLLDLHGRLPLPTA
jgi:hypothetical protein